MNDMVKTYVSGLMVWATSAFVCWCIHHLQLVYRP